MSVKKKAKKVVRKKAKKKDERVWNFPTEQKTKFVTDCACERIGEDAFRVSFFEQRIDVNPGPAQNNIDCVATIGMSKATFKRIIDNMSFCFSRSPK